MTQDANSDGLDQALLDRFAAIVGERYALRSEQDIAPFVTERRGLFPGRSSLVLRPGSVDEVSRCRLPLRARARSAGTCRPMPAERA